MKLAQLVADVGGLLVAAALAVGFWPVSLSVQTSCGGPGCMDGGPVSVSCGSPIAESDPKPGVDPAGDCRHVRSDHLGAVEMLGGAGIVALAGGLCVVFLGARRGDQPEG